MARPYALGKRSLAICDRCGGRAKYVELRTQVVNGLKTGLKVCSDCLDVDHPQLRLNRIRIDDPQALRDARPEIDIAEQRRLYGLVTGVQAAGAVGTVTAVIS